MTKLLVISLLAEAVTVFLHIQAGLDVFWQ